MASPLGSDQCSYPDEACPAGYSWSELSGSISGVCVADVDGGIDAPIDSPLDSAIPIDGPSATGWAHTFSSPGVDVANGLTADTGGNVYVVGSFSDNGILAGQPVASGGGTDAYVVKISPAGQTLWVRRFGGTGIDTAHGVAARADGIVVVGSFSGTVDFGTGSVTAEGAGDSFVLALTSSGETDWVARGGGSGSAAQFVSVAVDGVQNIFVSGEFSGTANFGGDNLTSVSQKDIVIARYTAGGLHTWSRRYGDTGGSGLTAGLDVLANGNIVTAGTFTGTIDFGGGPLTSAGTNDVFVAILTNGASEIRSLRFGSPNSDIAKSVRATPVGFAIAGCFAATASFGSAQHVSAGSFDAFVAAFDSGGNGLWSQALGSTQSECAQAIAVKPSGTVLATGTFKGSMSVGAASLTSAGTEDIWLVEFAGTGGASLTARRGGGAASDAPTAITAIGASFALAGNSLGAADMFGQPLVTGGLMDGFVVQSLQ